MTPERRSRCDNLRLTRQRVVVIMRDMSKNETSSNHAATFLRIKAVRAEAIEHTAAARRLATERRELMERLVEDGVSQAEIARELGVTRQAIQTMLAC
jgi:DNA-binding NarL/FixJ family response regulator